ncbi:hypothetical protein EVAR_20032_1 [Eumeta japonica]|uniref:Uncharacterized protein n=1 Tax=Eumeta variegata TaxID=151549 RepID=A0A4C1UHW3_EUMVA|nr:hypothetical protein EVAR_20032_1 [Eumeta japonica]
MKRDRVTSTDRERSGHLLAAVTEENVLIMNNLFEENRRITYDIGHILQFESENARNVSVAYSGKEKNFTMDAAKFTTGSEADLGRMEP